VNRQHAAHAVALGEVGALVQHAGAARIDAGRRVAEHDRAHLDGMALHEAQHLRARRRHRHQMIGRRQVEAASMASRSPTASSLPNCRRTFSVRPWPR